MCRLNSGMIMFCYKKRIRIVKMYICILEVIELDKRTYIVDMGKVRETCSCPRCLARNAWLRLLKNRWASRVVCALIKLHACPAWMLPTQNLSTSFSSKSRPPQR
jgi:hypothetical protein